MKGLPVSRSQKGFTIIELVVVILLLGILTATALPRFMDVGDDAHAAVVDAVEGGLSTSLALFRAQWVAEGQPNQVAGGEFADSQGNRLYANTAGYPVGTSSTIGAATCSEVYNILLQSGRPELYDGGQAPATPTTDTEVSSAVTAADAAEVDVDFVAVLTEDSAQCEYYYVAQYPTAAASGETQNIQRLTYNIADGSVNEDEFNYAAP